jgi:pilus assembly protein FimV
VFDEYREKFNAYFTGFVPEFEAYSTPGEPLESYAQLCAQIAELWPTPDALHYIERCLVRDPLLSRDTRMSLDAFRDLLMLHGVLTRVMSPTESILAPFSIKPQAPGLELIAVPPRDSTYAMTPATPELDLELDLDLTEQSNNLIEMDQPKPR